MNAIKIIYYVMLSVTSVAYGRMIYEATKEPQLPLAHVQTQNKPAPPVTQSVSTFAFALQNCFVGNAQKSCLHHAKAVYHPPLVIQKNAGGGDKVIQEVSELEVVSQNCAAFSGSGGCNGTMQATASMGPITQKVLTAGGHPNSLDLTGLTPVALTPGKHRIKLPVGEQVTQPATNVSYYILKPTAGPLQGQEVEIIFQNLTAYTQP